MIFDDAVVKAFGTVRRLEYLMITSLKVGPHHFSLLPLQTSAFRHFDPTTIDLQTLSLQHVLYLEDLYFKIGHECQIVGVITLLPLYTLSIIEDTTYSRGALVRSLSCLAVPALQRLHLLFRGAHQLEFPTAIQTTLTFLSVRSYSQSQRSLNQEDCASFLEFLHGLPNIHHLVFMENSLGIFLPSFDFEDVIRVNTASSSTFAEHQSTLWHV
ncbi:hypothetical protein DFS33DRAFT_731680 [Desarmillaria ectypa]|nr:hypothetical protein DFS33DRAFT_731680 [Desarmillaria ectypa]